MESGNILEELIYNLGYPVFNNQWILYEETVGKDTLYQVKSVSLPNLFPKFETGTLPTGVQYYTSVEFDKEWSLTLEEDTNLSVLKYCIHWSRSIYNHTYHRFKLSGGNYVKDFSLALFSPANMTALDVASIASTRLADWGVNAAKSVVNSALGRLSERASNLISGGITNSGAGVTLVQRTSDRVLNTITDTLQSGVSTGLDMLLENTDFHSDSIILTLSMIGTILKSVEKLDLDYEEGDPIQWKVTLASDQIKVASKGHDLVIV